MVKFLIFWALVFLVPTEALTDSDDCLFENKYFTLSIMNVFKNQTTNCQEDCTNMNYCLLWQDDGREICTFTVLVVHQMNDGTSGSVSGIANCGLNLGEGASCGEIKQLLNQIVETESKIVKEITKKEDCKAECLNMEECLTWRWNVKRDRCIFQQYTLKDSGAIEKTFGVSCSTTAPTTTAPTTTTPTTSTTPFDECSSYTQLDLASRSVSHRGPVGGKYLSDKSGCSTSTTSPQWMGAGWYRMIGEAGTKIPEYAPGGSGYRCGGSAYGWLDGTHPTSQGDKKDVTFCFRYVGNNCAWSTQGKISVCDGYVVYYLVDTKDCGDRYCATN